MKLKLIIALGCLAWLSACTQVTSLDKQNSGYLGDGYAKLKTVKTPDGVDVRRWINPDLKKGDYQKIIVRPVTYFPAPHTSDQVKLETLDKISAYLTRQIRDELADKMQVVTTPGPGTMVLQVAITGVKTPLEGLQWYEVIPVALVFAGGETLLGERDEVTVVYAEGKVTDAVSGKVLAMGLRQGTGKKLRNEKEQLDVDGIKEMLDTWATGISNLTEKYVD
jgi:hypothetical protein